MSHRTQLTLTDDQYARLVAISGETGLSLSELVRQALDATYAGTGVKGLTQSFGTWRARTFDGRSYVEGIRRGLASRLEEVGGRSR
jgi:hypothetical protein